MKSPLVWLLVIAAVVLAGRSGDNSAVAQRLSAIETRMSALADRADAQSSFARDRDVVAADIDASPVVTEFAGDGHLRRDMLARLTGSDRQEALFFLHQRHARAMRLMLEARTDFAAKKFEADAKLWMQSYYELWSAMFEKVTDK